MSGVLKDRFSNYQLYLNAALMAEMRPVSHMQVRSESTFQVETQQGFICLTETAEASQMNHKTLPVYMRHVSSVLRWT